MKPSRFSLVDLAAIVAVCGLGLTFLLPALAHARAQARKSSCTVNLLQMGLALHNYHDSHGVFPPGRVWEPDPNRPQHDNGVAAAILPYLEQVAVYNSLNFNHAWYAVQNRTTRDAKIEAFLCPDDQRQTVTAKVDPSGQPTNYAFSLGSEAWLTNRQHPKPGMGPVPEGIFFDNFAIGARDVIDGFANTVMASEQLIDRPRCSGSSAANGECSGKAVEGDQFSDRTGTRWIAAHPSSGYYNARRTPNHPGPDCFDLLTPKGIGTLNKAARSKHEGGVNVLMGDGRVMFAPDKIDLAVWRKLHTRGGNDLVEDLDRVLKQVPPAGSGGTTPGKVEVTLRRKSGPTNVQDDEGRWQYAGGEIILEEIDSLIGHFSSAIRVSSSNPLKAGAVRMTLFMIAQNKWEDPPQNLVLDGTHSFSSGNEIGSVAAASQLFRQYIGQPYRLTDGKLIIGEAEGKPNE